MAADSIAFIDFIFFIWISYFQIHTTVALRRLVLLASCIPLKVRFEEIVKAICQGGWNMTYLELKRKHQDELSKFPLFFAFNESQFEDGMNKLGLKPSETDKINRINACCYCKKSDSKSYKNMYKRFALEKWEALKDDNYVLEMFQCEMKNHEYDLTHDDKEVIEACGLDMFEMNSSQRLRLLYIQAKKSFLSLCYD